MLHAWRLMLQHPSKDTSVVFRASIPEDFQAVLVAAGMTMPQDHGFALG
jgi:hypothetical protein